MDARPFKSRSFLSTPEEEARFWGLVAVAIFVGIGAVIFFSLPPENSQIALAIPGATGQ